MKQKKSLASNSAKKRRILIGCAIGGVAVIMTGAGIGIGYAIWHSKNSGDIDPSNSLTIEYSRSFDLMGMEPVNITPTVKTSSGDVISDASFAYQGVLPTDLAFDDSNGVISGRPPNQTASNSFIVYVSASVDGILVGGIKKVDWNITPQSSQAITDADLNTLCEGRRVTEIYFGDVIPVQGTTNSANWSGNDWQLFLHIYQSSAFGVVFDVAGVGGDASLYINIFSSEAWGEDASFASNIGMTFTWVKNTKILSITYTVDVPVYSVSTDWSSNISGGTFSGYTF